MKYLLFIAWLVAVLCAFAGTDSARKVVTWGPSRPVPIEKKLPGPRLTLANNDPETLKFEHALRMLVLKSVKLQDATLLSVLDGLRKQSSKASEGKIAVNFVLHPATPSDQRCTLNLSNVPFTEVLKILKELTYLEFVVEQNAIVVKPKANAAAEAPTSAQ